MSSPLVSQAALAAGVPARFIYWTGRSGRRYLFTSMNAGDAAELESGVAIAVDGERIIWVGEVGELAMLPGHAPARKAAVYVHLLAATLAERRGVIWDLRPVETAGHLRLAA
jgi:hypothetical protein